MTAAENREAKRCVRHFQRYDSETRANRAASHRLGHRAKQSQGETFWTHPDLPGRGYPTRILAARAAIAHSTVTAMRSELGDPEMFLSGKAA